MKELTLWITCSLFLLFYNAQVQPVSTCGIDVRVLLPEKKGELNIAFKSEAFTHDTHFKFISRNPDSNLICTTTNKTTCVVDASKEVYYVTVRGVRQPGRPTSVFIENLRQECGIVQRFQIPVLERCNNTHPTCGTLRQVNIPRPGENVTLEFSRAHNLIEKPPRRLVTYWINKTSNDYVGFGVNTLTLENVSKWMQGEEYYVQCTADSYIDKCTQPVALQIKENETVVPQHDGAKQRVIVGVSVAAGVVLIVAVVASILYTANKRRLSQQTTSTSVASKVKDTDTSQNVPTVRPISAVHEYAYITEDEALAAVVLSSEGISGPDQQMQRSAEGAMGGISNPYQQLQRPSEAAYYDPLGQTNEAQKVYMNQFDETYYVNSPQTKTNN